MTLFQVGHVYEHDSKRVYMCMKCEPSAELTVSTPQGAALVNMPARYHLCNVDNLDEVILYDYKHGKERERYHEVILTRSGLEFPHFENIQRRLEKNNKIKKLMKKRRDLDYHILLKTTEIKKHENDIETANLEIENCNQALDGYKCELDQTVAEETQLREEDKNKKSKMDDDRIFARALRNGDPGPSFGFICSGNPRRKNSYD